MLHTALSILTDTSQAVVHFEAELLVLGYFTSVEPIAMIPRHFVHSELIFWSTRHLLAFPSPLEGEVTRVSKWQGFQNNFLIQLNFLQKKHI